MSKDDRKPVSIVADEDEDSDETVVLLERPPSSSRPAERGLSELSREPDPADEALLAPPPSRPPRSKRPLPDLAGFADDDDEDDTEFLPKDQFLGRHVELQGKLGPTDPESQTPARVRSLDSVGKLPLASASEGVSLVAEEEDDPETAILQPPPRRLASLEPIAVEDHDDVTLSRPIVHRRTFRPSGEGTPKRVLEEAGGPPPTAWAPKGARSVIELPEESGSAEATPARGVPPPGFEGDEETQTGDGEDDAVGRPSLSEGPSDESSETLRDLTPPVRQVGPDSETATLARPGVTSPALPQLTESELDEDALVVDDELPPEISAPSRAAPGAGEAPPLDALPEAAAPHVSEFGRVTTDVRAMRSSSADLDSIADAEPGTLIVEVPEEATVFLDGTEIGQGPTAIGGLDRFATYTLRVHCPGFLPWSGSATLRGQPEAALTPELRGRG